MNWLRALSVVILVGAICWGIHRAVHGVRVGLTPLAGFMGSWLLSLWLYLANPFGLDRLSIKASWLVIGSILAFIFGYSIVVAGVRGSIQVDIHFDQLANARRLGESTMAATWRICAIAGGTLFLVYLIQVRSYLSSDVSTSLYLIRYSLGQEGAAPGIGFYFFYFFQVLVPVSVLRGIITRRKRYYLVAACAGLALVMTTGRTNFILAALWAALVILLVPGGDSRTKRQLGVPLATMAMIGTVFVALGRLLGKTYENSALFASYGIRPPVPGALIQPIFYLSGPIPYLSHVLVGNNSSDHGANLFRPFLQLSNLIDPTVVPPPKVQPFIGVPYMTNIGTYLSPIYRDFGSAGLIFCNIALGMIAGCAWACWLHRRTERTLLLVSVVTVFCIGSTIDAQFSEMWVVILVALMIITVRGTVGPGAAPRLSLRTSAVAAPNFRRIR